MKYQLNVNVLNKIASLWEHIDVISRSEFILENHYISLTTVVHPYACLYKSMELWIFTVNLYYSISLILIVLR